VDIQIAWPNSLVFISRGARAINMSFIEQTPIDCVVDMTLYNELIVTNTRCMRRQADIRETMKHGVYANIVLLLVIYPKVTSTLLRIFKCQTIEGMGLYLRADYRISCDDSTYDTYMGVSIMFLVLLAI